MTEPIDLDWLARIADEDVSLPESADVVRRAVVELRELRQEVTRYRTGQLPMFVEVARGQTLLPFRHWRSLEVQDG